MRNLVILAVLALAACNESSGWNPNYSAINNGTPYAEYLQARRLALHGKGPVPEVIPVQLPAQAPTSRDIAGIPVMRPANAPPYGAVPKPVKAATATATAPVAGTGPYPGSTPVLVRYAHQEQQNPGANVYKRTGGSVLDAGRTCSGYASSEIAQRAFIAGGGPILDPKGMDPDGDGFVCGWDPRPVRNSSGL